MRDKIKSYAPHVFSLIASAVFLGSLRYKFTNAPETQVIFCRLDAWAGSFGAGGLFAQTGLFSQYVIGSAELVASACLLLGVFTAFRRLQTLGIDPNNDGGGLFAMAVTVWVGSLTLLIVRRKTLFNIVGGIRDAILTGPDIPSHNAFAKTRIHPV